MKLLVTSDIHGDLESLDIVTKRHKDIMVHLNAGDLCLQKNDYERYHMIAVKGNNDYLTDLPPYRMIEIENHKIFLTHGHLEHVKFSLEALKLKAAIHKVDLVVFGHTHKQYLAHENGIIFLNPGALGDHRHSYAVYDNGVVTFHNVYEP